MANYNASTIARIADINLGIRVDKAALAIAGISTKPIFTVSGGAVLVKALVGTVATTKIQNQACNLKFVATATGGAATDMSADGSIIDLALGGMVSLPGESIATATHVTATTANSAVPGCNTAGIIVREGSIGFATSADNTGSMKFSLFYVPLDDGAYVTAV